MHFVEDFATGIFYVYWYIFDRSNNSDVEREVSHMSNGDCKGSTNESIKKVSVYNTCRTNIYRITAVLEVKTDIITSIAASPTERVVILVKMYIKIFFFLSICRYYSVIENWIQTNI